jgi:predicted PurR-regulated permease PerM
MESSALPIPKDLRWRRLLGVALFLALLYVFRNLAPVLICFVIFERALGFLADWIVGRTQVKRSYAVGGLLLGLLGLVSLGGFYGVKGVLRVVELAKTDGQAWVESVTESGLIQKVRDRIGTDSHAITDGARTYALQAFGYLSATAYVAIFVFVGFILAVMYLFEQREMDDWFEGLEPKSVVGTLGRWLTYVADAIAITVRLQVVVAIFNAVFTLPLLLFLGLPNVPLLFLMVLLAGMVPVVGGVFSGLVLCLVAYDAKGFVGVGVFLGVTFILSKVESYYLSPRLTAQHVKLPGIMLVVSLLMFETVFGFWGLFLSFPALYVALRIANEWKAEDAATSGAAARSSTRPPPAPTPSASVPPAAASPPTTAARPSVPPASVAPAAVPPDSVPPPSSDPAPA